MLGRIALGSGSPIKIEAVQQAFPHAEVVPVVDAPSGVRPQPIGQDETCLGATNRARAAQKAAPNCDAWIGIENGMWPKEGGGGTGDEDAAIIVMLVKMKVPIDKDNDDDDASNVTIYSELSEAIDIPPKEQRPFAVGRNGEWSVVKDPHILLTGKPRKVYLVDALLKLAKRIK